MGLDMYAYRQAKNTAPVEFHYWRKHPNLHGWMENRWRDTGGEGEFNCVDLRLLPHDLDLLERHVLSQSLPPTVGFFFGASDPESMDDDLEFIATAREAIANGESVTYDSWW